MWGPNYDWTPDQCHGSVAMTALQRMLLQYEGNEIYLFPAWPKEWDVDFKLHAPFNTTIEVQLKDGNVEKLIVNPAERKKDVIVSFSCSSAGFSSTSNGKDICPWVLLDTKRSRLAP